MKNEGNWYIDEDMPQSSGSSNWYIDEDMPQQMGMGEAAARAAYSGAMRVARGITAPIMESGLFGEALAEQSRLEGQRRQADYQRARQAHPTTALIAGTLGQVPGEVANLVALGRLAKPLAMMAPGVASWLQGTRLGNVARGGLTAGALGALNEPGQDEDRLSNAQSSALFGAALPAAYHAGKGALNLASNLRPSKFVSQFGESFSPEMAERARIAAGTSTPLGDVIGSPSLKRTFENYLPNEKLLIDSAEGITKKARGLVQGVSGHPDEYLKNVLSQAFKNEQAASKKLFYPVERLAKESNLNLDLNKTKKIAKRALGTSGSDAILQANPQLSGKLKRFTGLGSKEPSKPPSIRETKLLKSELFNEGERLSKSQSSSDRYAGGLYKRISSALEQDIKKSIAKTQNPDLKAAYNTANKNYREKFSPFLTKEVFPLFSGKKGTDALVESIIKPGGQDRTDVLAQVQKALPEKSRGEIGKAYLAKKSLNSNGEFDVRKVSEALKRLGNRQTETLFGKEKANQLKDWQKLYEMNSEAIGRMYNPKTGARGKEAQAMLERLISSILGAGLGAGFSPLGSVVGGIAGAVAGIPFKKGAANLLTSEAFRDKVIQQKMAQALKNPKLMPNIPFSGFNLGSSQAPYEESY